MGEDDLLTSNKLKSMANIADRICSSVPALLVYVFVFFYVYVYIYIYNLDTLNDLNMFMYQFRFACAS